MSEIRAKLPNLTHTFADRFVNEGLFFNPVNKLLYHGN